MDKRFVVGVDIGGTKISCALSDLNGSIIKQYVLDTEAQSGKEAVVRNIFKCIDQIMPDSEITKDQISAIGIGSPGPLDAERGIIIKSANLPFENFPIVELITEKYKLPAYLENDANVAAIGENMFGAGKGTKNMVFITVSTGVGGGAIIDGKFFKGSTSNSLEIGHMTILPDGPKCNCGNIGCLEALSSGTAIGKQGRVAVESGMDTSLKNYTKVTAAEVFQEAEKGDTVSQVIIDRSLYYLGIGVANTMTLFDPEMIVIGGGVSKAGSVVFEKLQETVNKRCMSNYLKSCRIVPAGLGGDAGVVGAVALAILNS